MSEVFNMEIKGGQYDPSGIRTAMMIPPEEFYCYVRDAQDCIFSVYGKADDETNMYIYKMLIDFANAIETNAIGCYLLHPDDLIYIDREGNSGDIRENFMHSNEV